MTYCDISENSMKGGGKIRLEGDKCPLVLRVIDLHILMCMRNVNKRAGSVQYVLTASYVRIEMERVEPQLSTAHQIKKKTAVDICTHLELNLCIYVKWNSQSSWMTSVIFMLGIWFCYSNYFKYSVHSSFLSKVYFIIKQRLVHYVKSLSFSNKHGKACWLFWFKKIPPTRMWSGHSNLKYLKNVHLITLRVQYFFP